MLYRQTLSISHCETFSYSELIFQAQVGQIVGDVICSTTVEAPRRIGHSSRGGNHGCNLTCLWRLVCTIKAIIAVDCYMALLATDLAGGSRTISASLTTTTASSSTPGVVVVASTTSIVRLYSIWGRERCEAVVFFLASSSNVG